MWRALERVALERAASGQVVKEQDRESARPVTAWVLVTGAGKRLGRAVALAAGARRFNVVVHYHSSRAEAENVVAQVRQLGADAALVGHDLSDPSRAGALIDAAARAAGAPITALVNCAAIFEWDDLASFKPEQFRKHMEINALGPLELIRAFVDALPREAVGAVVNFLDFKLASPYPDHLSYTLSKYALDGATHMLARALAPRVRVNAVAPGYVLAAPGQPPGDYARLHAQNPLQYGVTGEDVAAAVLFLLESRAVTGQTLFIDSGLRFQAHERDFVFR